MTAAERILHVLGISAPQEIDLEAIAWDQGAIVNYRPLESCEARIIGSSGQRGRRLFPSIAEAP
jgi:hypothetical protein